MITKSELKGIVEVLKDFGILLTKEEKAEMSQMTYTQANNRKLQLIMNKLK